MTATRIIHARKFVERRWRWSWLRLQWQVLDLAEDYVFRSDGRCIEGMEEWQPL